MIKVIALSIALAAAMIASVVSTLRDTGKVIPALVAAQTEPQASVPDVLLALAAVGINAEGMAAAGFDGAATSALLTSLRAEHEAVGEALAAKSALSGAEASVAALRLQLATSGQPDALQQEIEVAETEVSAAGAAWEEERSEFLVVLGSAATAAVGASGSASLLRISANADTLVPVAYRVLELAPVQWEELIRGLADRAAGVRLSDAEAAVVASAESAAEVAIARSNIASYQRSVEEALASALMLSLQPD